MSIKTRLERAAQRVNACTREHGDACECRLIHIVEGQSLTEEEQAIVDANKRCFARHALSLRHVGFNTVRVAAVKARSVTHCLCAKIFGEGESISEQYAVIYGLKFHQAALVSPLNKSLRNSPTPAA